VGKIQTRTEEEIREPTWRTFRARIQWTFFLSFSIKDEKNSANFAK
jgi:hypothetical protein